MYILVWNIVIKDKGMEERIDRRSHADRGLEEQPTILRGLKQTVRTLTLDWAG